MILLVFVVARNFPSDEASVRSSSVPSTAPAIGSAGAAAAAGATATPSPSDSATAETPLSSALGTLSLLTQAIRDGDLGQVPGLVRKLVAERAVAAAAGADVTRLNELIGDEARSADAGTRAPDRVGPSLQPRGARSSTQHHGDRLLGAGPVERRAPPGPDHEPAAGRRHGRHHDAAPHRLRARTPAATTVPAETPVQWSIPPNQAGKIPPTAAGTAVLMMIATPTRATWTQRRTGATRRQRTADRQPKATGARTTRAAIPTRTSRSPQRGRALRPAAIARRPTGDDSPDDGDGDAAADGS